MNRTHDLTAPRLAQPALPGLSRLVDEVVELVATLLNPRRVIAEVEAMSALHRRAAAVEASDPALAKRLRDEASRIGLR
jgi:hypothetical protein